MRRQLDTVQAFIGDEELIEPGGSVLVGLSGGVDSTVLVEMLYRLGYDVSALHVNYRLRGEGSDEDERFVRSFCDGLGVHLQVESYDTARIADERGTSVQETARELRYEAFERSAREIGMPRVAVGHHRDDQAETVLLNLFRGSGPEGLAGIPVQRPLRAGSEVHVVRPLLCLRRSEVKAYALDRNLCWREDPTNLKPAYRRSAIRSRIMPLIEEHFGAAATENIVRSAELMRAYVESGLDVDVRSAFEAAAALAPDAQYDPDVLGALDIDVLRRLDPVLRGRIVLEAIRRWLPALGAGRRTVAEIEALLDAQPGRRLVHPTGVVWRERGRLLFVTAARDSDPDVEGDAAGAAASIGEPERDGSAVLGDSKPVETPIGTVELSLGVTPPEKLSNRSRNDEYVDADRLGSPLIVRRWRPGDRFIPLGMKGAKKISDFLTDEKVPSHRRGEVLVVLGGGEIVWVIGQRIAHSVRVRPETENVARLRFHPAENTSRRTA